MWLFLGITSGFFHALMSATGKKALRSANPYLFAFSYSAFSLPFLLIAILWLGLAPTNFTFWWATLACATSSIVALTLYAKALQNDELSLTVPLLSFTPAFLILTSKIMLRENPSLGGVAGIMLIIAGTYVLELKRERGILGPFKVLVKNKSALFMLIVALIYAVSSNWNKIAVANSNPITYLIFVQIINAIICVPLIYFKSDRKLNKTKPQWKILWLVGLFTALSLLAQMTALTLTIVPYVISLKRTSALFSIILGFIAFKERNIKPKLLGSVIMIAGVLLISIS